MVERLSVCLSHMVGLLLSAVQAGDINQQRQCQVHRHQVPTSSGATTQCSAGDASSVTFIADVGS